jgi:hypothetical protein
MAWIPTIESGLNADDDVCEFAHFTLPLRGRVGPQVRGGVAFPAPAPKRFIGRPLALYPGRSRFCLSCSLPPRGILQANAEFGRAEAKGRRPWFARIPALSLKGASHG